MKTYLDILRYGKSHLSYVAISFGFLLVFTLFSAVSLMSVIPFLEILFQQTDKPVAAVAPPESLWDFAALKAFGYYKLGVLIAQQPDKSRILLGYCGILLGCILVKNVAKYLSEYCMIPFEQRIVHQIRERIFSHLSRLDLPFYTGKKKGEIIGLMVSDVQVIEEATIKTVMNMLREPLTMLTFLLAMLLISWKMTMFTFLVLPLTALLLAVISKKLKKRASWGQEALGRLITIVEEYISAIRVVKSYQKEAFEAEKFHKTNEAYSRQAVAFRRRVELASPLTEIVSMLIVCVILLYGGSLILSQNGGLKANEFIGFIALFSQFLLPIRNLSTGISKINKAAAAYQRIEQLLQIQPQIQEKAKPERLLAFQKEITFKRVCFGYNDSLVLQDINLTIPKGKTLALVGQSGSGKSTLADLLPRFYEVKSGSIQIDGIDVRDLAVADLRRQIGYVSQEGVLFHDSILNNIAYGDENPDMDRVVEAAKTANAWEFITQLSGGLEAVIGERGTMLSGGQRQRIAIARAVYRNPAILILDEATSNLDTESEKWVQEALDRLMQARTALVIAHRLSTIVRADLIAVMDKGKIVESGTHEELLALNGVYRKLYEIQFEGE